MKSDRYLDKGHTQYKGAVKENYILSGHIRLGGGGGIVENK